MHIADPLDKVTLLVEREWFVKRVAELEGEVDRLREYAGHLRGCPQYGLSHGKIEPRPCNCGWERVSV